MQKIETLMSLLHDAKAGSRSLDSEIAQLIGLGHSEETPPHPTRMLSLVKDAGKIPAYTTSLESAYRLSQHIAPGNVGGYTWRDGKASAQIGDPGQVFWASTPALALCLAALHLVSEKS